MDNRVSVRYSDLGSRRQDVTPILEGELDGLPCLPSRTVRVFLSSTFSDMSPERNKLMEHAYPKLKEYCRQKYRFEFQVRNGVVIGGQVMDLRWGIREQSHDDHTIIEFCIREIENCKKQSIGPSFVALIGQKYGYRPFPPKINAREFEAITGELQSIDGATDLLSTWFKKDTNSWPTVYVLQPVSLIIPHFNDKDFLAKHKKACLEWQQVFSRLQELLRQGVLCCVNKGILSTSFAEKYFISVTEYEIQRGLLFSSESPCTDGLCFMRDITNLEKNLSQRRAHKYIDVNMNHGSEVTVDVEAQKLLELLRKDKILKSMSHQNVVFWRLFWKDVENTNPSDDPDYLERFSNTFCEKMKQLVDRSSARCNSTLRNSQLTEVHQHLAMCTQRARLFRGRDDVIERIRSRLQVRATCSREGHNTGVHRAHPSTLLPIVIHGHTGSGRTSVIAKVALSVKHWMSPCKPILILRFLGASSLSCSIRLLLGNICWQLASIYGVETSVSPDDYPSLVVYFTFLLQLATSERPLVFILDGLDQLSSDHKAHRLAWLPSTMPPHVFFIVSTLTDHPTFHVLSVVAAASEGVNVRSGFVEVPPLGRSLALSLIREWLKSSGRTLVPSQLKIVSEALAACNTPLYTTLVFDEIRVWTSYESLERTTLERTVEAAIGRLFDRIERYHGMVFVSHALGYLTASKDGLSEVEMDDILSLDDVVLNDVFQHWLPPVRRIPPLLVPRLQDALSNYLVRREANETAVIYWYNAEFLNVAKQRYLSTESQRLLLHSLLAHYFMGTWGGGTRKPFKYSRKQILYMSQKRNPRQPSDNESADRMVPRQPLVFGPNPRYPGRLNYNLRKLSELPHHLLHSGMASELQSQVLFNYDWLHAKLNATCLNDVLHDFDIVLKSGSLITGVDRAEVALVASSLRVAGSRIADNPNSLAFDLLGQLLVYYDYRPPSSALTECPSSPSLPSTADETPPTTVPETKSTLKVLPFGPVLNTVTRQKDCVDVGSRSPLASPCRRMPRRVRENSESCIRSLLQQCDLKSPVHSALLPLLPCFEPPTGMALCVLEGHSSVVSDLAFLPSMSNLSQSSNNVDIDELVSIAADGTITTWDLSHGGERCHTIDLSHVGLGRRSRLFPVTPETAAICNPDGFSNTGSHRTLAVIDPEFPGSAASLVDLQTGHVMRCFGDRNPAIQSTSRLASRLMCRQRSIYDISTGKEVTSLDRLAPGSGFLAVAIQSSLSSGGVDRLLIGGVGFAARLFDLNSQSVIATLESDDVMSTTPSAVALSGDGRLAFVGYADTCRLCVFDVQGSSSRLISSFECDNGSYMTLFPVVKEIFELAVCPSDDVRVLMNISGRKLVIYDCSVGVSTVLDVTSLRLIGPGGANYFITKSSFSLNGRQIVAANDTSFHVWLSATGQLLRSISLHTQPGFPFVLTGRGSKRNLAATGSTLHSSICVWDLDLIGAQCSATIEPEVDVAARLTLYDGPVDYITVARCARLIFVRRQMSLTTHLGYKYAGWSGVDVWDIAGVKCDTLLPYGRYGTLLQMEADTNATRLALLFQTVNNDRYVALISFRLGISSYDRDALCTIEHSQCAEFAVSPDWTFMTTWSCENSQFKLWNIARGLTDDKMSSSEVVTFSEVACPPVFTFDSQYVVYVDGRDKSLVVYGVHELAPRWHSSALVSPTTRSLSFILRTLPGRHQEVMVTSVRTMGSEEDENESFEIEDLNQSSIFRDGSMSKITIWQMFDARPPIELHDTVGTQIVDVSKDGLVGVDGCLQVFNLVTGALIARFRLPIKSSKQATLTNSESSWSSSSGGSSEGETEETCNGVESMRVRLTDDGKYVIWTERRGVCVGRTADSTVVGRASLHDRPCSLVTHLDYGYTVLIGCSDGRLVTARLAVTDSGPQRLAAYRPVNLEDRINFLLDAEICGDDVVTSFDPHFQLPDRTLISKTLEQSKLPTLDGLTVQALLRRADIPHAVIPTESGSKELAGKGYRHQYKLKEKSKAEHFKVKNIASMSKITEMWRKSCPMADNALVKHDVINTQRVTNKSRNLVLMEKTSPALNDTAENSVDGTINFKRFLAIRRNRKYGTGNSHDQDGNNGANINELRSRCRLRRDVIGDVWPKRPEKVCGLIQKSEVPSPVSPYRTLGTCSNPGSQPDELAEEQRRMRIDDVVQSALESSGKMVLGLCGFRVDLKHHQTQDSANILLVEEGSTDDGNPHGSSTHC